MKNSPTMPPMQLGPKLFIAALPLWLKVLFCAFLQCPSWLRALGFSVPPWWILVLVVAPPRRVLSDEEGLGLCAPRSVTAGAAEKAGAASDLY